MTRIASVLILALSLSAVSASAQTVVLHVDLGQFNAHQAKQVEDDGDPRTPKAWLLTLDPDWFMLHERFQLIVPMPDGRLCAEDVFAVTQDSAATVELDNMDGRSVLMVFMRHIFQQRTSMDVITLDRRRCR